MIRLIKFTHIIAESADGYIITESDAEKFHSDNPLYEPAFNQLNKNVVLRVKKEAAPERIGSFIYANRVALILDAGETGGRPDHTKTVIYVDKNRNKQIDGDEPLWDLDGNGLLDGTKAENDLSGMFIHGGSHSYPLTGDTQFTMLGGSVFRNVGASGIASLTGDTDITIKGGSPQKAIPVLVPAARQRPTHRRPPRQRPGAA